MKIRINADDFGVSLGVNSAIEKMFHEKKLHSASIIYGCGFFDEAIAIAKRNPDLKIGLHLNLSNGKSAAQRRNDSLLTDQHGNFKNGFVKLLLLAIFKKKQLLHEVEQELAAQIAAIKQAGIEIYHIDGHRHVHFIPGIFQLVVEAARANKIQHVRVINENLFSTWSINYSKDFLWNGGLVKWLILRSLGLFNQSKNIMPQSYFFSILYSCTISPELISKIKTANNFDEMEIMIHPGNPGIDAGFSDLQEKKHLSSSFRVIECL